MLKHHVTIEVIALNIEKKAGILLPVFSLPGKYGIGDFGPSAFEFIDKLKSSGMKFWQILPLNPVGYGNSPYQPFSSIAGDEIYIDLDALEKEGLLTELPGEFKSTQVNYAEVRSLKTTYLKRAFRNFTKNKRYEKFASQGWAQNWSRFISESKRSGSWVSWKNKNDIGNLEIDEYEVFVQYIFYTQWGVLKKYANENGIQIIGDIPFYVGMDSDDVWLNKECFLLDENHLPTHVAGVPPDYFSKHGQRWGNPLYDWDHLQKTNYKFILNRIKQSARLYDIIRIDHFRAFDTFYKIPTACPTAEIGEWVEAPGHELLDKLFSELTPEEVVAEDLGELRAEVHELRDFYKLKGMEVVQFAFDPFAVKNEFARKENKIVYTGTHDNDTLLSWYESKDEKFKAATMKMLKDYDGDAIDKILKYTLASKARIVMVPIQDVLKSGKVGRVNTPGTVGSPNWEFKLESLDSFDVVKVRELLAESGRL